MKFVNTKTLFQCAMMASAMALVATSCSKEEGAAVSQNGPVEINLSSNVAVSTATRAIVNAEHSGFKVSFARLDEATKDQGDYAAYTTLSSSLPATVLECTDDAVPSNIVFDTKQYYDNDGKNTKLIAWHPQDAAIASGVVTASINGENDIMLTQELTGNKTKASQFGVEGKIFAFEHQLTQLQFKAYAVDTDASATWGTIDQITIDDRTSTCKITLPTTVEFEGTQDLKVVKKNWTDESAIDESLTIPDGSLDAGASAAPCGYAMFEPVANSGSDIITISVTTSERGVVEVPVSVPTAGFEKGKAYEIVLKFNNLTIVPKATVTAWATGEKVDVEM